MIYCQSNCTVVLKASSSYHRYSAIDISVVSMVKVCMLNYFHTHFWHESALVPLSFLNLGYTSGICVRVCVCACVNVGWGSLWPGGFATRLQASGPGFDPRP